MYQLGLTELILRSRKEADLKLKVEVKRYYCDWFVVLHVQDLEKHSLFDCIFINICLL